MTLALLVTEGMRARAAGFMAVPDGLRRIGARLDLGDDLNLEGAALFDSHAHAVAAASIWSETVRVYARQPMVIAARARLRSFRADRGGRGIARPRAPAHRRGASARGWRRRCWRCSGGARRRRGQSRSARSPMW